MPDPFILKSRGLRFPGFLKAGFDPTHLAASGMSAGRGISVVASGGNMINLLSGKQGTVSGTPAGGIRTVGPVTKFSGASDRTVFAGNSTAAATNTTYAAIVIYDSFTANFQTIIDTNFAGTRNLGGLIANHNFGGYSNGTVDFGVSTACPPTLGVPYFQLVTVNGTNFFLYAVNLQNGSVLTRAITNNAPSAPGASLEIGGDASGFPLSGALAAVMWSPQFLSNAACLQWCADPWSFWYPQQPKFLVAVAAAAASGSGFRSRIAGGIILSSEILGV